MSQTDMNSVAERFLLATGITMAEIGNCLGVSRQAVQKHIKTKPNTYLDEVRLTSICEVLDRQATPRAKLLSEKIKVFAHDEFSTTLALRRPPDEMNCRDFNECDEVWILSNDPLELRDRSYMSFMFENVFTHQHPVLVAYFLSDEDQAFRLAQDLDLVFSTSTAQNVDLEQPRILADVHICLTNAVACCPHLVIFDAGSHCVTKRGNASAEIRHGVLRAYAEGLDEDHVCLQPDHYVQRIVKCFDMGRIGKTTKKEEFCPIDLTKNGIRFQRYATWLCGQRKFTFPEKE